MFPEEFFNLIESTVSKSNLDGRGTESCRNPDYHFRDKKTKEGFWVECKFRSNTFDDGTLQWCEYYQLKRYKEVMEISGEKTYIMIGLGGKPQNPEKIFCIDLKKNPYNKLFKSLNHLEKQLP